MPVKLFDPEDNIPLTKPGSFEEAPTFIVYLVERFRQDIEQTTPARDPDSQFIASVHLVSSLFVVWAKKHLREAQVVDSQHGDPSRLYFKLEGCEYWLSLGLPAPADRGDGAA
jgi:hypothetical protein